MASDIFLDTSIARRPRLIVDIPREAEAEIRHLLESLAQENVSAQTAVLDALRVAAEQIYFWSPQWQSQEHAADAAIARGQVRTFDTMDEMLDFLDKE